MKINFIASDQRKETLTEEVFYIKNMVCSICIRVIQEKLIFLALPVQEVELGWVRFKKILEPEELNRVGQALGEEGFEIILSNKSKIVEQIKELIGQTLYPNESPKGLKYSEYLSKSIGRDYSFLSHTFSALENLTIEKYVICQKADRAKTTL
ncbi:AraC family transcriptional regulator [Rufibacter sp. LB8]|uniref:AraC family transcriptional regulator n=1 Tax=Rufibacter sp. LB8 TaxID=2777781 RepID=UPI00178C3190|nr:AraC family transcriptional regulator [Rufibacter sp. LB8]